MSTYCPVCNHQLPSYDQDTIVYLLERFAKGTPIEAFLRDIPYSGHGPDDDDPIHIATRHELARILISRGGTMPNGWEHMEFFGLSLLPLKFYVPGDFRTARERAEEKERR